MNIKKALFFPLFGAFFAQLSCTGSGEQITARIDGWGDDTVVVEYFSMLTREMGSDTLLARDGRFGYTPPVTDTLMQVVFFRPVDQVDRPGGRGYQPGSRMIQPLPIPLPGERLKITGRVRPDAALEYTVRGVDAAADLAALRTETLPLEIQTDSIEFELIETTSGDTEKFFARQRELNAEMRAVERERIRARPDRLSSAFLLLNQPLDSFPTYYALLGDGVKNGIIKSQLDAMSRHYDEYQIYLANNRKEFVGQPAPDFTLRGIDGKPFTLSTFDNGGKYIVLDFWGSWCGPCIVGMPRMKEYYGKYRGRLEIVGIACNDTETDWKNAVVEHGLPWLHVINDAGARSVSALYSVGFFPTKIILAPDRTILHIFEGEDGGFYTKLDELMNR